MTAYIGVLIGGILAIFGSVVTQLFISRKEIRFERMRKLEEIVDHLHRLSHSFHSIKIGNFEKAMSAPESQLYLTLIKIYFSKYVTDANRIAQLNKRCWENISEKDEEAFMDSLSDLDVSIDQLIDKIKI